MLCSVHGCKAVAASVVDCTSGAEFPVCADHMPRAVLPLEKPKSVSIAAPAAGMTVKNTRPN